MATRTDHAANNCTSLNAYLGGTLNTGNVYNAYYDNLNRLRLHHYIRSALADNDKPPGGQDLNQPAGRSRPF